MSVMCKKYIVTDSRCSEKYPVVLLSGITLFLVVYVYKHVNVYIGHQNKNCLTIIMLRQFIKQHVS